MVLFKNQNTKITADQATEIEVSTNGCILCSRVDRAVLDSPHRNVSLFSQSEAGRQDQSVEGREIETTLDLTLGLFVKLQTVETKQCLLSL